MGRIPCNLPLLTGSVLSIGGKEVEVDCILPKSDYLAARPYLKAPNTKEPKKQQEPDNVTFKHPSLKTKSPHIDAHNTKKHGSKTPLPKIAPSSAGTQTLWKNPLLKSAVVPIKNAQSVTPRHNPQASGAIVMRRPAAPLIGRQLVDVVVDPLLGQHLSEHQNEGVKFM